MSPSPFTLDYVIRTLISVLPVVVFLISLIFLDSYKLVHLGAVLRAVLAGLLVALVCLVVNGRLTELLNWDLARYSRYVAPVIEEALKATYVIFLIKSKRVGFMVDAAILAFALGAGFAIVENPYYYHTKPTLSVMACVVRGFGTAVMHGGATALFAIISQSLAERYGTRGVRVFLPGVAAAFVVHSLFNHFLISPVLSAIGLVVGLPLVMMAVFHQSEKGLRKWLGVGFDTDAELFEMITKGNVSQSRTGEYLMSLKTRFPPEVVVDMLCLLRIHLELSIRAKGLLLMRESGYHRPPDAETREKFDELAYLEKSIGPTGRLAMAPFLHWSSRDLWQLHMLGKK